MTKYMNQFLAAFVLLWGVHAYGSEEIRVGQDIFLREDGGYLLSRVTHIANGLVEIAAKPGVYVDDSMFEPFMPVTSFRLLQLAQLIGGDPLIYKVGDECMQLGRGYSQLEQRRVMILALARPGLVLTTGSDGLYIPLSRLHSISK